MQEDNRVNIISDAPEKGKVHFGFDAYARTLASIIANSKNKTPLVIGIYGPWGSGKTTLMEIVRRMLQSEEFQDKRIYRRCKSVWFQAWKYKSEEEILAALIEEIFRTMKQDGFFEACKARVEELVKKLKPSRALGKLAELASGVDISEIFAELPYKEKLGFYETFHDFFKRLIWDYLNWRPKVCRTEEPDDRRAALVIFIDDLDRCPQPRILEVLETIKLFMDEPRCIFVIGAAGDIIEKALKVRYEEDAAGFMDKIVQVSFNLPLIPGEDFSPFVESISGEIKGDIAPFMSLILPSMENNPRQLKRFLNNLSLQRGLIKSRGISIKTEHILLWSIIDYIYPALKRDISDNPKNFYFLKDNIKQVESQISDKERWEIPQDALKGIPESFHAYVRQKELVEMIKKFDCIPEQLNQLITMKAVVESRIEAEEKIEKEVFVLEEKMTEVQAGEFLYGDDKRKEKIEQPYMIDIYPVTNAQYEKFMSAGGYENKKYWSESGWLWKTEIKITQPGLWRDPKWSEPDNPVVSVSFYEVEAFAK